MLYPPYGRGIPRRKAKKEKIMRVSSQTETRQGLIAFALALPLAVAIVATTLLTAGSIV